MLTDTGTSGEGIIRMMAESQGSVWQPELLKRTVNQNGYDLKQQQTFSAFVEKQENRGR